MQLIRDKSLSTRILILYELYTKHYSKLSPLAEKIGITQQAVSEYTIKMKKAGLIEKVNNKYVPSIEGMQLLQNELTNLKKFVDDKIKKIPMIENCFAIAKTSIKQGHSVDLFMEKGWLTAYTNKKSSSTGVAINNAEIDECVKVKNLLGIVNHKIGKIYFLELKPEKINVKMVKNKIQILNIDKIGILDAFSKSACYKIGIKPDFEFGVTYAAIDAAIRGMNTIILGHQNKIKEAFKLFEEINDKSNKKIFFEWLLL